MAAGWFQISAGADLNSDMFGLGADDFDIIAPAEVNAVYAPINGPISIPAPWSMEYRCIRAGFVGGTYSAGAVWPGVQIFTTPDAQWVRKADRAYSNGAMTVTPWVKVLDFNCPGETY